MIAELRLDVTNCASAEQFYSTVSEQLLLEASDLETLRIELPYAGQKEVARFDRSKLKAVELRVVGFAKCKPALGDEGKAIEHVLRESRQWLTVVFDHAAESTWLTQSIWLN